MYCLTILSTLLTLVCFDSANACSSRAVPKPRATYSTSSSMSGSVLPTSTPAPATTLRTTTTSTTTTTTTPRPNITFPTYKCPETFDAWYCLNEATCFAVKIGELPVYSCECANGFMGQRCEYKELDGSYMPKRPRPILEKASIASGAICALILMIFICLTLYLRYDQKPRALDAFYDDDALPVMGREDDDEESSCCCNEHCCIAGDAGGGAIDAGGNGGEHGKFRYRQRLEHALFAFAITKRSTKI